VPRVSGTSSKTIDQKKRAVITRPFGREPELYLKITANALIFIDFFSFGQVLRSSIGACDNDKRKIASVIP
jgi:hypothetical protein